MQNEIKIGDMVKDICGNEDEVIDIEYSDDGEVWRYILFDYDGHKRYTWSAYPDYTVERRIWG